MGRQKTHRFEYNKLAENVIERGKDLYTSIKGNWNKSYFNNNNPIALELACGKGEYTVGLGKNIPNWNFIGIDIKGDRISRGSKAAAKLGLNNIAFLRTSIQYLDEFFEENEVDEIWLIHPDPQPRDKEERKRLTNQRFLNIYKKYLKLDGLFKLKTDSFFLYEYSLEIIKSDPEFELIAFTDDLYNSELNAEHYGIETHYEKLFREKGHSIHYIKAKLIKKAP